MPRGDFFNRYSLGRIDIAQGDRTFIFQIVPAVVQTARDELNEMDLRDRLIKKDSISVLFSDNGENNHYYKQIKKLTFI